MHASARPQPSPSAAGATRFAPPRLSVEPLADGGMILRSPVPLNETPRCLGVLLEAWAARAPERVFLAERAGPGGGWRTLTYADALDRVGALAQELLARDLSPERPLLILAENGVDHALVALAAMHIGIPVSPVSTAYARLSQDFGKLRHVVENLRPKLVFVDDPARYGDALRAVDFGGAEIVAAKPAHDGPRTTPLAELFAAGPGEAVERAFRSVGPETVAKILFTSGSTDMPKGVVNTQRMMCANQEALAQVWPFVEDTPPLIVDWLPWNHTFGGNFCFNLVLRNGGSLYVDEGKPAPGLIERTAANLRELAPTLYFNVPRGYAMLLDRLEADAAFNAHFFSRLQLVFYAGAALPQSLWARLEACSQAARGEVVPMVSSWGLTETAPMVTSVHFPIPRAGNIGLPTPGSEVKLRPSGGRLEMLVRGPNVTPGYWRRPDLTEKAFDDGWLVTGDAAKFADLAEPSKGIVFDGRVAENFKLTSGTWVNVGVLRVAALAATSPLLEDAVVTGHDRDEIGLLAFPNLAACRALCPDLAADCAASDVVAHRAVREAIAAGLARHNSAAGGSSTIVARLILLTEPPSIDANEITDKGYINQRAVLERRADLVGQLYAESPGAAVIAVGRARQT